MNKNQYTINFLEKYVPKKHHVAIEEVEKDSLDGYFIYLTNEYISTSTRCHTIREDTLKEIKKELKYIKSKKEYFKENNLPRDFVL